MNKNERTREREREGEKGEKGERERGRGREREREGASEREREETIVILSWGLAAPPPQVFVASSMLFWVQPANRLSFLAIKSLTSWEGFWFSTIFGAVSPLVRSSSRLESSIHSRLLPEPRLS